MAPRFPKSPRSVRVTVSSAIPTADATAIATPTSPDTPAPDAAVSLPAGEAATPAGAQALERLRAWPGEP
ncbi:MAG: hypothetical protein ACKOPS_06630 [Cyanobium sp.]